MKKIICIAIVTAAVLFGGMANAADVNLAITVPDAYVLRTKAAVEELFPDCVLDGLNAKQCAEKHLKEVLRKWVRQHERNVARTAADATVEDIGLQ